MFAYCGNNPVNNADPSGNAFINVDWDFDGLPNSLFIDVGAGAGYAMAGVANSSGMAEDVTYAAKKAGKAMGGMAKKVGGWIATGAEFLWDAYMRGYNLQQNAQMQEAQMMIDMFDSPEDVERSIDIISATTGLSVSVYEVAVIIVSPTPVTVKAVAIAVVGAIWGIRELCRALQ